MPPNMSPIDKQPNEPAERNSERRLEIANSLIEFNAAEIQQLKQAHSEEIHGLKQAHSQEIQRINQVHSEEIQRNSNEITFLKSLINRYLLNKK